ncbi:MAG: OB-fold nucleic acid binding domain-containing protein, partial [Chloroflexota bacterium]
SAAANLWSGRVARGAVEDSTPQRIKLAWEKEHLGLYLSDHPLMPLEPLLAAIRSCNIAEIEQDLAGKTITIGGIISAQRRIATRAGKMMLAATIEDLTGSMEVIVFPRPHDQTGSHSVDEAPVVITGKVDFRDEVAQLLCETVQPLEDMVERREPLRLEIELRPSGNEDADVNCLQRVIAALHSYRGNDRFNLRLGGHRLDGYPGATTWWNPKLDKLLEGLLGPNRVRVLPAAQAAEPMAEYIGPLGDPSYEAMLAR